MNKLPSHDKVKTVEIVRVNGDRFSRQKDLVVREEIFSLSVNGIAIASIACMPKDLDKLAVGFLFSERIIDSYADIRKIMVKEDECVIDVETIDKSKSFTFGLIKVISSGREAGRASGERLQGVFRTKISSRFSISVSEIKALMRKFQNASTLFTLTGGVHSAAICKPSSFLFLKEDIGRHNAVDKVIGECLMKGMSTKDKILLLTGRVSSDILMKAVLCKIPVLVSQSAPTHLAIRAANISGMALIGFARGERMNVYSHAERLLKG